MNFFFSFERKKTINENNKIKLKILKKINRKIRRKKLLSAFHLKYK